MDYIANESKIPPSHYSVVPQATCGQDLNKNVGVVQEKSAKKKIKFGASLRVT